MGSATNAVCVVAFLAVLFVAPAPTEAELIRVEITSRADVLNGKAFGNVGPYEKLRGLAYFAVDPLFQG